jgi:tRNA(adenine34) deaminase
MDLALAECWVLNADGCGLAERQMLTIESVESEHQQEGAATTHTTADELWMEEALREAVRAQSLGEVPVGAIVVVQGRIVGRGCNQNLLGPDPTAHAEVVALRQAALTVGNHRLLGGELFVTVEPCAMCAGAIVQARLSRLVYGTDDPKAGAVRSALQVLNHPRLNHRTEVTAGILAGRCANLLQAFFRSRRNAGNATQEEPKSDEDHTADGQNG